MTRITGYRHCAVLAVLALASTAGSAGEVTISRIDVSSGTVKTLVSGELKHAPAWLFEPSGDLYVTDACGAFHSYEKDAYGETTFTAPLGDDRSMADVRLAAMHRLGAVGIGHDGKPWTLNFTRTRGFSANYPVASPVETKIDLSKTRLFVANEGELPTLAFFDDGRLLGIQGINTREPKARFIEPRNAWGDVTHAVSMHVGTGRARQAVLITLDRGGQMQMHTPVIESEADFSSHVTGVNSKPIGTATFAGTKGLFGDRSDDVVWRWTEGGDLYRVNLNSGREQRIGSPGAFRAEKMVDTGRGLYMISQRGGFDACGKETVAVNEAPQKPAIVADAEELKAMKGPFYDVVSTQIRKGMPQDLWEKDLAQLGQILSPWFEDIHRFEETRIKPVRAKVEQFVSTYGDERAADAKLAELTGTGYFLSNSLSSLQDRLAEWTEYRRKLAEEIAYNGSRYFALAKAQNNLEKAIPLYLKARPYGDWALRFDPENERALKIVAEAEQNAEFAKAAQADAIAKAVWPDDAGDSDFDRETMRLKVLKHFQANHKDEDHEKGARYFAFRFRSGWVPGLTNWLGHILEWRISGYIARTIPEDPDHALIIPVQIGTQTNQKGLPFENRYFRSDSYKIPIERVPADDAAVLSESLELIRK